MARPPDPSIDARVRDAAAELLGAGALSALRQALSASQVAANAGVDRHTIGRRFGGDDLLLSVCEQLFSLSENGVADNTDALITLWSSAHDLPAEDRLRILFRLNFQAIVGWRSFRLGMLMQTAAIAASAGGGPNDTADAVLAARRHMYDELTSMLSPFLAVALRATGRRLVSGMTVDDFTSTLNSLSDGLALRHLLQPDVMTEDLAVRAMEALASALTVPGIFHDRRRPDDEDTLQFEIFRLVMETAARAAKDGIVPTLRAVEDQLHGKADVRFFFASDDELLDSVQRWLVGQDDMWLAAKTLPDVAVIPAVRETLASVARMVDGYPGVARGLGGSAFAHELRDFLRELLVLAWDEQSRSNVWNDFASQLVEKALTGTRQAGEWELMLDLLEHQAPASS